MVSIRPVQKYDCDVLVVGGGPGGSAAACYLARAGIKTLVLESGQFPRDKICGDAVSPVALAELKKLGITDTAPFREFNEINSVSLFVGEEKINISLPKTKDLPYQGRIIPRMQLDHWIYDAARREGATYLENTRLSRFEVQSQSVLAEVKEGKHTRHLKAKVIIGADGSNSTVARIFYGGKPQSDYQLLGLRAYYQGVNGPSDRCDIYFTGDNFPGLYWFFPAGTNKANIGLAMIARTLPQNEAHVKTLLLDQIKNHKSLSNRIGKGELSGKIQGWPLTFSNPKNQIIGDRLLLVGDAAGLINPLSGDGIQYALQSARWAADCLTVCARSNDFSRHGLMAYKEKIDGEMAYDSALSSLLIQITRNRSLTPLWMEILQILFERARSDRAYADIIAGIFSGTYPSYRSLDLSFLLKSALQGGIHLGRNTAKDVIRGPEHWAKRGISAGQFTLALLKHIKEDPDGFAQWAGDVVRKGWKVSGHFIKNLRQ